MSSSSSFLHSLYSVRCWPVVPTSLFNCLFFLTTEIMFWGWEQKHLCHFYTKTYIYAGFKSHLKKKEKEKEKTFDLFTLLLDEFASYLSQLDKMYKWWCKHSSLHTDSTQTKTKKNRDVLLVLLCHLFLHVSSVMGSSRSHTHKLWLTQELHPWGLHPDSHATLSDTKKTQTAAQKPH